MFGGLAFLIGGNMAVSASGQGGLLLRVDPAQTDVLSGEPEVRRFEMRGREMDGWLRVDVAALDTDDDLRRWVSHGVTYARSLPAKGQRAFTDTCRGVRQSWVGGRCGGDPARSRSASTQRRSGSCAPQDVRHLVLAELGLQA